MVAENSFFSAKDPYTDALINSPPEKKRIAGTLSVRPSQLTGTTAYYFSFSNRPRGLYDTTCLTAYVGKAFELPVIQPMNSPYVTVLMYCALRYPKLLAAPVFRRS